MEGQPLQPDQGQSNGNSQLQMNQLQQMQNNLQQQLQNMQHNNMAVNQPGQQMGGQVVWPLQQNQNQFMNNNGVINVTGQQNPFNQMNWQQQSQNQPPGGDPRGNPMLIMSAGNSTAVPMNNVMHFQGVAAQAPERGGIQNPTTNNNAPPSLNQQQAQAQTALWLNAFRAFQGAQNALPNGGGNVIQGGNSQLTNNVQGVTMENLALPQTDQTASLATSAPAPNAFNGGNAGGNQSIYQMNQSQVQVNLSQMQTNQLQAQMNLNQIQQPNQSNVNSGTPSSFDFNNSNQMNMNAQQQSNVSISGNPNNVSPSIPPHNPNGNASNQTQWVPQGNVMTTNTPSSDGHQQLLLQQFLQKQQVGDGNSGTYVQGITGDNRNASQQLQQSLAHGTINGAGALQNETRCQGPTPALSVQTDKTVHVQQVQGNAIISSRLEGSTNINPNPMDPAFAQLLSPDPIVTGGKVHATSFPLTLVLGGQIEGDKMNSQVEGICVQGGNRGHGRCLDGNFAGGWQSNADLGERQKMIMSIINLVKRTNTDRLSQKMVGMAKKLEEHLYRSALTKDEYSNPSTLKRRLHLTAKGIGVLRSTAKSISAPAPLTNQSTGMPLVQNNSMPPQKMMQPGANLQHQTPMQSSDNAPQNNGIQLLAAGSQGPGSMSSSQQISSQMFQQQLQMQQIQSQTAAIACPPASMLINQSSTTNTSENCSRKSDARAEKKKQVLLQQQRRLELLRHSKLCKTPNCTTKFCVQMGTLWKHLKYCKAKTCPVPHCVSSRCVLSHHANCARKGLSDTCEICFPVQQRCLQEDGAGDDWNDDWDNFSVFEADGEGASVISSNGAASTMSNPSVQQVSMPVLMPVPQIPESQPHDHQSLLGDIHKKHSVLAQIRSQKATLLGQNKELVDKISITNPEDMSQQLKNQMSLLHHLNVQFERQESYLQSEINRQTQMLQQISQQPAAPIASQLPSNLPKEKTTKPRKPRTKRSKPAQAKEPPLSSLSATPTSPASKKRSVAQRNDSKDDNGDSQPKKSPKHVDLTTTSSTGVDSLIAAPSRYDESTKSDVISDRGSKGPVKDENFFDTTGALSSMQAGDIEKHLDSLVSGRELTPRCLARKILPLVRKLLRDDHGWVFKDAVDPVALGLDDYLEIVKHPMCLGLVEERLNTCMYENIEEVERDIRLVFDNAILFNGEDSDIGKWAKTLLDTFNEDINILIKGLGMPKEEAIAACKNQDTCCLCGKSQLKLEPPLLFCSGTLCGMTKIRRNAFYHTDPRKQNYWCDRCYNGLPEDKAIQLDDGKETKKSLLIKLKNDLTPEEQWVQCDTCQNWSHQVCSLYGNRQHSSKAFACPKCTMTSLQSEHNATVSTYKNAAALPETKLSCAIEEGLSQTLSEEYQRIAKEKSCDISEIERADGLCVRVVMSLEKKHQVRDGMLLRYSETDKFPKEFPVTTKCICLFQKIHGVDVLLFGMYVYEYGDECPSPNKRRVYISYLDSVQYLQPPQYRTLAYHAVLCEYLRFVRSRGFHTAHIWSCPPSKGDEYIFYCHPPDQLVPKDEMLRAWYVEALKKAQDKGIVIQTRTIYDEYFKDGGLNPETGEPFDPTSLPYFEGDYIPGEIEKIISIISKDETPREELKQNDSSSKSNASKCQKKEGKRRGLRSNPGELVNQGRDKVMNRLDLTLSRMKQNFFVAQLLSDDFIKAVELGVDVSGWAEDVDSNSLTSTSKQIGKNPDLLDVQPECQAASISKVSGSSSPHVIGNTVDEDPSMEQECMETRIAFLNFCQKKCLQFDELRRAKHSTLMLLSELHNPRAEKEQQFNVHLQVIGHAASCAGCESKNCRRMKQLFSHTRQCEVTYRNGCRVCCRLFLLLAKHARNCDADFGTCNIPLCERIRERQMRLLRQQQALDDRRRDEQNIRHQEDGASCQG